MSRLRADLLLIIVALIWGSAFIAQKTGMEGLGPFAFVGARFTLSFLVVLPLAFRESRKAKLSFQKSDWRHGLILSAVFFAGAILQQTGLVSGSVTNAGFLTSLYVIMVPFASWLLFRRLPPMIVWPAGLLALAGAWFLNGGVESFSSGDLAFIGCAIAFSGQVAGLGWLVQKTGRPLTCVALQYGMVALFGWLGTLLFEHADLLAGFEANAIQILYTGLISGGIAYTLQAVAQQHTQPSHAAIIMAGEAPFAALGAALLLGERLSAAGWLGCGLILLAIVLAEGSAFLPRRVKPAAQPGL